MATTTASGQQSPLDSADGMSGTNERKTWLFACTGMRRSGSTLQAMLVSRLADNAKIEATSPEHAISILGDPRHRGVPIVLKCHVYIPEFVQLQKNGQALIFHSYRDIRDVVASIVTKYSIPAFSFIHGGAAKIVGEHQAWARVGGAHVARYETVQTDLVNEILRLGAFMGLSISCEEAKAIAVEYSIEGQKRRISRAFESGGSARGDGNNALDGTTLLHRNHIQDGDWGAYRRILTPREIAALEWVCRVWMNDMGYVSDFPRWRQALAFASYGLHAWLHWFKQRLILRRGPTEGAP